MPELPEVEAARSAIADHCIGKKIIRAIIANDSKVIDSVTPPDFESSLVNKTIVAVHRKGKNMWIQLDSPPFPTFQFGMTGAVYIKGVAVTKYKRSAVNDTDEWPSKFSKFFIELNDGLEISFTDKRRFAKVRLLDDPPSVPPICELGPDALLEPLTEEDFNKSLTKKKIAIKTLLLDQSFVSGIGNWVADEVLYQARIHPSQTASSLSRVDSARLLNCIKEVLEKAVEVGADSSLYPSSWIFHSREKKPGKAFVDGKKIDFLTIGGRTTAYVPELQKLSGDQATKPPAKPRKQTSKNNKQDQDDDIDDNGSDSEESDDGGEESKKLKSKQVKNGKAGVGRVQTSKKSTKGGGGDDEGRVETTKTRNGRSTAKRKPQGVEASTDASQLKKSKGEGNNADSAESNNDPSDNDEDDNGKQKGPGKSKPKRTSKQARKKAT